MEMSVYLNSKAEKPVFRRIVILNENVSFDFNRCISVMRDLFGSSCIVEFKVMS